MELMGERCRKVIKWFLFFLFLVSTFFGIKYWLLCPSHLFLAVCDMNQVIQAQLHSDLLSLPLPLYFAASPTCCTERVIHRQFPTSFRLLFSKNIPLGSLPVSVNLLLGRASYWDALLWCRKWLRVTKYRRLSSLDAAYHSQDHSSYLSGMWAHRFECSSKWNRKCGWLVNARGHKESLAIALETGRNYI